MAFLALVVALGGTALAATGQLVNITDPSTTSHQAKVDSSGALKTAVATRDSAFSSFAQPDNPSVLIGPTTATLALTRLVVENPADNNSMRFVVFQRDGTATACSGGATRTVAVYTVPAGTTVSDPMPTPTVLKALQSGHGWCLEAGYLFEGNPPTTTLPGVSWTGYTISGQPPANASASSPNAGRRILRSH